MPCNGMQCHAMTIKTPCGDGWRHASTPTPPPLTRTHTWLSCEQLLRGADKHARRAARDKCHGQVGAGALRNAVSGRQRGR